MTGQRVNGQLFKIRIVRCDDTFTGDRAVHGIYRATQFKTWTVQAAIGLIPLHIKRMIGIFDVGRNVALNNRFGRADYMPEMTAEQYVARQDERVDELVNVYDLPPEWNEPDALYVTIIASREVVFLESDRGSSRHNWAHEGFARRTIKKYDSEAEAAIGFAVSRLLLGSLRISGPILETAPRFFLSAVDRHEPSPLMRTTGSASLTVGRKWSDVLDELNRRPFSTPADLPGDQVEAIGRIGQWHLHAYNEHDRFRRFLWSYIGLEIIANSIAKAGRYAAIRKLDQANLGENVIQELLWPPDVRDADPNRSVRFRFALSASVLSPETASTDVAEFKKINDYRNGIHGRLSVSEDPPPAFHLFDRYSAPAVAFLSSTVDPRH